MRSLSAGVLNELVRLNQTGQGRLGATLTAGGATLSLASWLVPDTLSTIVAEIERDYAQFVTGDLTVELDDPLAAVRVWLAARGRADFELIITYAGAEALIFYGTVSADDLELLESGRWRVRVRDWSYSLRGKLVRDVWPPPGLTGDWPLLDVLDDVATALSLELVPGVPLHLHPDNISVFSQYRDRHYPAYGGDALCTRVVGGRSEADPDWLVIVFRPGDPDTEEFTWHYYAVSKTTGLVRELAAESYDPATGVRYPSGGPYQAFGYKIVKCARSAAGRYYYFWVGRYAFARIGSGAYTAPLLSHIFLFDSQTGAMR
ncbi:hypothetical protein FJY71_02410, partial [candidate division WOR-3 bacterium]|nr:hypothetical protein [candidate division WOR-3 bacterium]